jgi:CRP-like cAMP-binding protein
MLCAAMAPLDTGLDQLAADLGRTDLFRELSLATRLRVAACLGQRRLGAGERLFAQGDPGDALYIVVSGRLRVCIRRGRESSVIGSIGPGESVGEMAVMKGGERSADVLADEESELLVLSAADYGRLLGHEPGLALALARLVGARLLRAR